MESLERLSEIKFYEEPFGGVLIYGKYVLKNSETFLGKHLR